MKLGGCCQPTTPPSVKTRSPIAILAGKNRIAMPNPPRRQMTAIYLIPGTSLADGSLVPGY
ncbi:MAG: hypothetical protein IJ442_01540 [Bacteroidaceae bacterium]|nr:hypothetical protein [Bacteroidaceae bacterium]